MRMDLLALEYFLAVAETGSFTLAAKKVSRTQSAVSQKILTLEQQIGKKLFIRGRDFVLSPHGEILFSYAQQMIKIHREACQRFSQTDLAGEVRFGLPEDFASVFLQDILAEFFEIHPRIRLSIECDLTVNLFNRFRENNFDLILVKMNRPKDVPHGFEVWSESLQWVGYDSLIDPCKPLPLILSPQPCVYRTCVIKALEKVKQPWRVVFSSPNYASTIAALKAGIGLSVMPHTMVPKDIKVICSAKLPKLDDMHVSLLKHQDNDPIVNSMERFILNKFK